MADIQLFDLVRSGGYDPDQVDKEIARLTSEIKQKDEAIAKCQNQIDVLGKQLVAVRDRYQQLLAELSMREKAADELNRVALKEANSVIETAQNNADAIISEAIVNAKSMLQEANYYNEQSLKIKNELTEKLQECLALIEGVETSSSETKINKDVEEDTPSMDQ